MKKIIIQGFLENDNIFFFFFKTYLKALLSLGPETAFNKAEKDSSFCGMCLVKCQINNRDIMHGIVMLSGI